MNPIKFFSLTLVIYFTAGICFNDASPVTMTPNFDNEVEFVENQTTPDVNINNKIDLPFSYPIDLDNDEIGLYESADPALLPDEDISDIESNRHRGDRRGDRYGGRRGDRYGGRRGDRYGGRRGDRYGGRRGDRYGGRRGYRYGGRRGDRGDRYGGVRN
ncbi:1281_t:CDS:2 [Ambispora gerdemannii]|uniref:1281_t:CDS:1 n=1 Tax=Ambispora gerdemannii TaxID=144530 RepID=A0A9N9C3Z7_9GLOM|nr:1281_t:CDS:2 [Ambispora gerdemannii]